MAENVGHKRRLLRRAMRNRNVVPLKPPLDCAALGARLRALLQSGDDGPERAAFDREVRGLRIAQRGMIAARASLLPEQKSGSDSKEQKSKLYTPDYAAAVQVSRGQVFDARIVLQRATPAEIRSIEQGDHGNGIRIIADQLRAGMTPAQRKRLNELPQSERGDAPARIAKQRAKALVWRQVCSAMVAADLPNLHDVVDIIRTHDRGKLVDRKLLRSYERLGELIEIYTQPTTSRRGDSP